MAGLSLDALTGPAGAVLRAALAEGVRLGTIERRQCLALAAPCRAAGHIGEALWLLAIGAGNVEFASVATQRQIGELLLATPEAADRAMAAEAVAALAARLDAAHPLAAEACLENLVQVAAGDEARLVRLVAAFASVPGIAESDLYLNLALAESYLAGHLDDADRRAARLLARPKPSRWSYRAAARLAVARGDLARAERLLGEGMRLWGPAYHALCAWASVALAQGRTAEARQAHARARTMLRPGYLEERQAETAAFTAQLAAGMAVGAADGGAAGRLGAAINYADPRLVPEQWRRHSDEVAAANTWRTISAYTNTVMFGRIEELLAGEPGLRKVVNYGALCGRRDAEMAERHPDHVFAGYEVSDVATRLNREHFQRANLLFGSDLEPLLESLFERPGGTVLCHCRTTDIMLPEAVKHIYRSCHAHGVDYLLSAEYLAWSLATHDYPDFSTAAECVHWDGILVMHDYDRIMPACGYRVVSRAHVPLGMLSSTSGEGRQESQVIELVLARRA